MGVVLTLLLLALIILVLQLLRRLLWWRRGGLPGRYGRRAALVRRRSWATLLVPERDGRLGELAIAGRRRPFVFYRPAGIGLGAPPPLLLVFHGGYGNPLRCLKQWRLNEVADRHGFAVAYPAAGGSHWSDGRETTGQASGSDGDDVAFVLELSDHLCREEGLDRRRVYALGASNGGMFSFRLALEAPHGFAAFGAALAALPTALARRAGPGPPVPMMMINAVDDALIPWHGGRAGGDFGVGGLILGVEATLEFWRRRNGCTLPRMSEWREAPMDFEAAAELYDFPPAAGGAPLRFLKLRRGGHAWPLTPLIGPGSGDGAPLAMTVPELIWQFFAPQVIADRPLSTAGATERSPHVGWRKVHGDGSQHHL